MSLVEYAGDPVAICVAARSLPNPPTGDGANVTGWEDRDGKTADEFEFTIIAGATVELAAGAMLVAEELHDTYPEESGAVTLTNATETVNLAAHGFRTGDGPVRVSGTLPAQLALTTEYYVIRTGTGTLQLASSRANAVAGTFVSFGSDGSAVVLHWVTGTKSTALAVSAVDATANTLTSTAHALDTGDVVRIENAGGALPSGLTAGVDYYAIEVDADTIKLATTEANADAGTAIDIGAGSGTQTLLAVNEGPTEAVVFALFHLINEGEAVELSADISYRERVSNRPGVTAYHLVADLDVFVPITAYVRGVRFE